MKNRHLHAYVVVVYIRTYRYEHVSCEIRLSSSAGAVYRNTMCRSWLHDIPNPTQMNVLPKHSLLFCGFPSDNHGRHEKMRLASSSTFVHCDTEGSNVLPESHSPAPLEHIQSHCPTLLWRARCNHYSKLRLLVARKPSQVKDSGLCHYLGVDRHTDRQIDAP